MQVGMRRTLFLSVALALAVPGAFGWSARGHAFVGAIAQRHLTPEAEKMVSDLLDGGSLAGVSSWADDIRNTRRDTAPWHYVNIPLSAEGYDRARDCPDGNCVVEVIRRFSAVVGDRSKSHEERAEALRFLVHFIGDVHQPLHCSDNNDRGGNSTKVRFLGDNMNLHQVWDGRLLDRAGLASSEDLETLFKDRDLRRMSDGDVVSWANESQRLARVHAYHFSPARTLGQEYVQENVPVVEEQLFRAGLRLAKTLNTAAHVYTVTVTSICPPVIAKPPTKRTWQLTRPNS